MKRVIFHIDVNSAFLSWESVKRLENGESDLREVPACIGGDPNSRTSIVAAKSIPAKKYGIVTGEAVATAIRKCPNLIVVPGDFKTYNYYSKAFKKICKEYTDAMQSFSIDEVFMDMTGMENIYPDLLRTAYEIKDRIKIELGFTVNVGIGENKLCAKMASDFEKPDKVHTLYMNEIKQKMWPLPVIDLFTCGKSTAARLKTAGINTIGDLARTDFDELKYLIGEKQAHHLLNFANGIDDDPVVEEREDAKSYGAETTVDDDLVDMETVSKILLAQADVVATRVRKDNVKARCVCVTYKNLLFNSKSHQRKLDHSTDITEEIYQVAKELMEESWNMEPLRLVGLSVTDIDKDGYEQLSFVTDEKNDKLKKLDSALDSIRGKFGNSSITRASAIDSDVSKIGKKMDRKS